MLQVKRIGHTTLTTPDLERQFDYDTRVVGLTAVATEKKRAILATKPGQEAIVLEHGDRPAGAPSRTFSFARIRLAKIRSSMTTESMPGKCTRSGLRPAWWTMAHLARARPRAQAVPSMPCSLLPIQATVFVNAACGAAQTEVCATPALASSASAAAS
jgi:hypothetical protein